ncbi:hypothetical protein PoB_000824600 [Plakobranchus ocellatus]|uniref:Uncharacterized protein n=1 Tax=Plakobranchus ocellatus TaxID=259542 RepID=A0AAV3Y3B3_9GAST|nr:hypothetical protein PoB_000824600 [Plakobranchus ocellatus]
MENTSAELLSGTGNDVGEKRKTHELESSGSEGRWRSPMLGCKLLAHNKARDGCNVQGEQCLPQSHQQTDLRDHVLAFVTRDHQALPSPSAKAKARWSRLYPFDGQHSITGSS